MLAFRYRNLTQRFLTYQEYWNRILRLIEEGKNPKDYRKLVNEKQKPVFHPKEKDPMEELYKQYVNLMEKQKKEPPSLEAFKQTLAKYEENIKAKYGSDVETNFSFEESEGTVKIKTKIKSSGSHKTATFSMFTVH